MLSDNMRFFAKMEPTHPRVNELLDLADKLDKAVYGMDVKPLMGAWARARRCWSEVTGEPVIPKATVETASKLLNILGGTAA